MNLKPRAYRVPVLRLTDVYDGDSVNGDPGTNDVIEPTPSPQQVLAQYTGQGLASTSVGQAPMPHPTSGLMEYIPEEPAVHNKQNEKDDYIAEPVLDASRLTYTPTTAKPQTQPPITTPVSTRPMNAPTAPPPPPPKPPIAQAPTPWAINPTHEQGNVLEAIPAVVETPPPNPAPRPTVAPLKKPEDPFKKGPAPDLPDMWEAAASRPAPQVAPRRPAASHVSAPGVTPNSTPTHAQAPSSATQSLIDQTLADLGLGTSTRSNPKPPVPHVSEPTNMARGQGPMAGNLANLRARVEQAHSGDSPANAIRPVVESAPAPAPQPPAPHVPETEHAKALANVAHALHTIHDSTSLLPEMPGATPSSEQAPVGTPSPMRHAGFLEEELVVAPTQKEGPSQPIPLIRTYKADMERTILHNKVSMVNVISAQEERRHNGETTSEIRSARRRLFPARTYMLAIGSFLIFSLAVGGGVYVATTVLKEKEREATSELSFTDSGKQFDVSNKDRMAIMQGLTDIRDTIEIDVNEVVEVNLIERSTNSEGEEQVRLLTAGEFFSRINARAPESMTRNLADSFVFGIHRDRVGKRHPFLVFRVEEYNFVYAGMMKWESGLDVDLAPLFGIPLIENYTEPIPQPETQNYLSFAIPGASTTRAEDFVRTTGSELPTGTSQAPSYRDISVSNQLARVLSNPEGEIKLLWAVTPDNKVLMLTTNPDTFREINRQL